MVIVVKRFGGRNSSNMQVEIFCAVTIGLEDINDSVYFPVSLSESLVLALSLTALLDADFSLQDHNCLTTWQRVTCIRLVY